MIAQAIIRARSVGLSSCSKRPAFNPLSRIVPDESGYRTSGRTCPETGFGEVPRGRVRVDQRPTPDCERRWTRGAAAAKLLVFPSATRTLHQGVNRNASLLHGR